MPCCETRARSRFFSPGHFVLQMSILFINSEGEHIRELSTIQVNVMSLQTVDVHYIHTCLNHSDSWLATPSYSWTECKLLKSHGFSSKAELIQNFTVHWLRKEWLRGKDITVSCASDPNKEMKLFSCLMIEDMKLPPWSEREKQFYHQVAVF